jgi:hypothetical protein
VDDETRRSVKVNQGVSSVRDYYSIEIDLAHRRREWAQAVAEAAQRAQVGSQPERTGWAQWAPRALASLRAFATPRLPVTCWNTGESRARTLAGGCASVS